MNEVEILREVLASHFTFLVGIAFGVLIGVFITLGVIGLFWIMPNIKEKINTINLIRKYRKDNKDE